MRKSNISREEALALLEKYNKDPFHIRHALTVEGVMRYFARSLGYGDKEDYWGITGLLHDIDFELYPEQHCKKAPELLREGGVGDDMIYSVCSHGYGICCDVEPKHEMEKVLFAADELTGLVWSANVINTASTFSPARSFYIKTALPLGLAEGRFLYGLRRGCRKEGIPLIYKSFRIRTLCFRIPRATT